jgi:hypothetical protein
MTSYRVGCSRSGNLRAPVAGTSPAMIGVVIAGRQPGDRLERALAPALVYIIATEPMHGIRTMGQAYHPPAREQECRRPIPSPPVHHPRDQPVATVARQLNQPRSSVRPAACCWPPTRLPLAHPASLSHRLVPPRRQRSRFPVPIPVGAIDHPPPGRRPSHPVAHINPLLRLQPYPQPPAAHRPTQRRPSTSPAPKARSAMPCARRMRA